MSIPHDLGTDIRGRNHANFKGRKFGMDINQKRGRRRRLDLAFSQDFHFRRSVNLSD